MQLIWRSVNAVIQTVVEFKMCGTDWPQTSNRVKRTHGGTGGTCTFQSGHQTCGLLAVKQVKRLSNVKRSKNPIPYEYNGCLLMLCDHNNFIKRHNLHFSAFLLSHLPLLCLSPLVYPLSSQ